MEIIDLPLPDARRALAINDQEWTECRAIHGPPSTYTTHSTLRCWWCQHACNCVPIGIPINVSRKESDGTSHFSLDGVFCSMNCALAYAENNNRYSSMMTRPMIARMRLEKLRFTPQPPGVERQPSQEDVKCHPAPHYCLLKEYGGPLTIEEFRALSGGNNSSFYIHEKSRITPTGYIEYTKRKRLEEKEIAQQEQIRINGSSRPRERKVIRLFSAPKTSTVTNTTSQCNW